MDRLSRCRILVGLLGVLLALAGPQAAVAQIEVPITFDLGDDVAHVGFLVGGFLAGEEGLTVLVSGATQTRMIPYDQLDRIEQLKLQGSTLNMQVIMNDGKTFAASAKLASDLPILVLADQVGEGEAATRGEEHTFAANNLAKLASVDFEAEVEPEVDVEAIKALNAKFLQALDAGDIATAVEIHNQIADQLGETDGDDAGDGAGIDDDTAAGDAGAGSAKTPTKPRKPSDKKPKKDTKKTK